MKNYLQHIKENNDDFNSSETNIQKIFEYIKSLPYKYRLNKKHGYSLKIYENGVDTALNNSVITRFYLKYLRNNKKTSIILPTPNLDFELYEKLNNLIKICNLYLDEESLSKPKKSTWLLDDDKSLNIRLFSAMCFQMMHILLYEDYFDVDFRDGNGHEIIKELSLPKNKKEFYQLFNQWNDKNGEIRHMLFYADSIPVVSTIERY